MKIKRNASFKLFTYGKHKDKYQIRLRVTFNSQRLDLGTNCQLNNIEAWNAEDELVKAGYKGPKGEMATSINDELRKCKDTIDMVFQYYEVNDKIPTPSEVQKAFKERMSVILPKRPEPENKKREQKPKEADMFVVFDEFTSKCGEKNAWTIATFEKMSALKADLQNFCPKVKLSELDEDALTKFVGYLRDEKKVFPAKKKKNAEEDAEEKAVQVGLNNTTIKKKLEYLTWFLRWARDVGHPVNPAFKTFKPTLKQTQKPIIYLSKEELLRVKNLDLSGSKLEPVRDIFLFCYFSSLRHSDADNLRRSDIKGDHMDVTTIKTGVEVQFNDNEKTKEFVITIPRKEHHINAPSNEGMHQVSNQGSLKSNEGPLKSNQGEVTKVTRLPITKKQLDIVNFCSVPRSAKEIMERLGITNQTKNRQRYITDLIKKGYLELTIPDNPTHMDQKYRRVRKK